MSFRFPGLIRPGIARFAVAIALLLCGSLSASSAAALGKLAGKIVGTDTGEPIAFADVLLIPADSTMKRVGGLTNADGTFLLEAMPGRYTLQVRMLSYATKRIEGIEVKDGELLPFSTALAPEALEQEEIVVEAKRAENTEASMLAARKKAASVGDAISAEQVRKSADRDAAEVLRRVTGVSVSDGKYVFVRGLGERYSSTEVDGVRIASPEENKRVVPLDLVPSNLVENIVVQKTYTADRPGEFGGGDVQVRTKDFPGRRTWSFEVVQGFAQNVTFSDRKSYGYYQSLGASERAMPSDVNGVEVPAWSQTSVPQLASMARSFANEWSPYSTKTAPNGRYSATYGDEVKLFGRSMGMILSGTFSRAFDTQEESQRLFRSSTDTIYAYNVTRWTDVAQLAGLGGLSYRLSPGHSLHLRGLYTSTADDEVRHYEGTDHNSSEAFSNEWQNRRNTRLLYAQRTVMSGSFEGKHQFQSFLGTGFDWKLTRSRAERDQPDRRDITYNRQFWFEGDTAHWNLGSQGLREYGHLTDDGWGASLKGEIPYRLGALGAGKAQVGYDLQNKQRDNFYRRFQLFVDPRYIPNPEAAPESIFSADTFDGSTTSGYLKDVTYNDPLVGVDNYTAEQRVTAGFVNVDVPFGSRVRGSFGLRVEHGYQDVASFALFRPDSVLVAGELDDTDWLPSGNLTWAINPSLNLRLAASQTISRPDLNELSPSPFPEYIGGYYIKGNPDLERALLDNYDVRFEAFPGLSEVLAVGAFYKNLRQPIERVLKAGSTGALLVPENSAEGRNQGVELEARVGLGRIWNPLSRFSINSNASLISSKVTLYPTLSRTGTLEHPLQGQADYLVNVGIGYLIQGRVDASLMVNSIGRRLSALGYDPLPDIYEQPYTTMDAALNMMVFNNGRLKLTARNLLDPTIERLQGHRVVSSYRSGRTFSIGFTLGS